jgi:hypothetical protein
VNIHVRQPDVGPTVTTLPPPPPEAELIRTRREARFMSMRQAALGAGISPTAWAEVETARRKPAPGVEVYKKGTAKIVSRMALFLGITPDEVRDRDRPDVADYMIAVVNAVPEFTERQKRVLTDRIRRDASDE